MFWGTSTPFQNTCTRSSPLTNGCYREIILLLVLPVILSYCQSRSNLISVGTELIYDLWDIRTTYHLQSLCYCWLLTCLSIVNRISLQLYSCMIFDFPGKRDEKYPAGSFSSTAVISRCWLKKEKAHLSHHMFQSSTIMMRKAIPVMTLSKSEIMSFPLFTP